MKGERENALRCGHPELWDDPTQRNVSSATWLETFWADSLQDLGHKAIRDGRPGRPDVVQYINGAEVNWELKLTSPRSTCSIHAHTLRFCGETTAVEQMTIETLHLLVGLKHFNDNYYVNASICALSKDDFIDVKGQRRREIKPHALQSKCIPLVGNITTTREIALKQLSEKYCLDRENLPTCDIIELSQPQDALASLYEQAANAVQRCKITKDIVRDVNQVISMHNSPNTLFILTPRVNVLKFVFLDVDDI